MSFAQMDLVLEGQRMAELCAKRHRLFPRNIARSLPARA